MTYSHIPPQSSYCIQLSAFSMTILPLRHAGGKQSTTCRIVTFHRAQLAVSSQSTEHNLPYRHIPHSTEHNLPYKHIPPGQPRFAFTIHHSRSSPFAMQGSLPVKHAEWHPPYSSPPRFLPAARQRSNLPLKPHMLSPGELVRPTEVTMSILWPTWDLDLDPTSPGHFFDHRRQQSGQTR